MGLTAKLYSNAKPKAKAKVAGSVFERIETFTGEVILYDDITHTYKTLEDVIMTSGSQWAEQQGDGFPKNLILPRTSKAWGIPEDVIDDMWIMNGDVSKAFGTAVHKALEYIHRYHIEGEQIQKLKGLDENYCLPKSPYLRQVVTRFVDEFGLDAMPEVFLSDIERNMVGQVDLLKIINLESKVCRVQDFKTTVKIDNKKLKEYQLQMSFYADILRSMGWTVLGLDLFIWVHEDNRWKKIEQEPLLINIVKGDL